MHRSNIWMQAGLASAVAIASASCGDDTPDKSATSASSTLSAIGDASVTGTATFSGSEDSVNFSITLSNCPEGSHGFHIHDGGSCGNDGTDAAGHWNPAEVDHGSWGVDPFHLGDIGNIVCDANGDGTLMLTTDRWTLDTDPSTGVMGHAVILHELPDDFGQPTGNAGARIACGVIALD